MYFSKKKRPAITAGRFFFEFISPARVIADKCNVMINYFVTFVLISFIRNEIFSIIPVYEKHSPFSVFFYHK